MTTDKPSFQPLYQQIRTLLAQRIAQGEWAAHEALPSEWALAESLGVSQGTVRKALTDWWTKAGCIASKARALLWRRA